MATAKRAKSPASPPKPFHLRFDITLGIDENQKRFINRAHNLLFRNFMAIEPVRHQQALWLIANTLGEKHASHNTFESLVHGSFHRCLQCIEASFESLSTAQEKNHFNLVLKHILSLAELDLGIAWERGRFMRSGSTLLDNALINDPLGVLSESRFSPVRDPLVKSLTHLLEGERRPELYSDAITDAYESLEACAKIITNRTSKDLSGNAENLISSLKVSNALKELLKSQLKSYITYANIYRHAKIADAHRAPPRKHEAEAFIYQTGIFIRLCIIDAA